MPGWGGTQLLPNLIGIPAATQVIIQNPLMQNKMLKPKQAAELGIADVLLEPADFLERSLEWAAGVVRGRGHRDPARGRQGHVGRACSTSPGQTLDERLHGAVPAAYRALDLLETAKDGDFADGTAAEDEALADLVFSEELRSGLYAFDLVQRRAKRPAGAPDKGLARPVTKVGIVGAGLMASQLALLFARRLQVPVVLTDLDQARVDKGVGYVHTEIDKLVAKGRLDEGTAAKLHGLVSGTVDKAAFADADFVIEAVFEDLAVKKQVWAELEKIVSPEAVLATNTSSLSITAMAAELEHPERVVGFHFFNPVAVLPLLEIVRGERTDDATLATAFAVGKQLQEVVRAGQGRPGVRGQPAAHPLPGRRLRRGRRGHPAGRGRTARWTRWACRCARSPCSSWSGRRSRTTWAARCTRRSRTGSRVSENLQADRRVGPADRGRRRRSTPRWPSCWSVGDQPLTAEQVRQNALDALAQEIRLMLDEGVVAEAQDIDLCMILGAGWPFHLGGVTPYLDRTGTVRAGHRPAVPAARGGEPAGLTDRSTTVAVVGPSLVDGAGHRDCL